MFEAPLPIVSRVEMKAHIFPTAKQNWLFSIFHCYYSVLSA